MMTSEVQDKSSASALILAVRIGNDDEVSQLLAQGADASYRDQAGQTARILAGRANLRIDTLKLLFPPSADLNAQDEAGNSSLHHAAMAGRIKNVHFLLARGADTTLLNHVQQTAAICAVRSGCLNLMFDCIGPEFAINGQDSWGDTLLQWVAGGVMHDGAPEALGRLLDHGSDPHLPNVAGVTSLISVIASVTNGTLEQTRLVSTLASTVIPAMLALPGNLNQVSPSGDTALLFACRKGMLDIVRLLVDAGARVDLINGRMQTSLMLAALHSDPSLLTFLLGEPIAIDAQDQSGNTALHLASAECNTQCIALLLEHGANWRLVNNKGKVAAKVSRDPAVRALFASWCARQAMLAALQPDMPGLDPPPTRRCRL
jgi:ankyrin repeat protein